MIVQIPGKFNVEFEFAEITWNSLETGVAPGAGGVPMLRKIWS